MSQTDIDNKQKELDDANAALDKAVKSYTYKGKAYDLMKLRDELIPTLEQELQSLQSQEGSRGGAQYIAELTLQDAQSLERYAIKQFKDKKIDATEVAAAQQKTIDAQTVLDKVKKGQLSQVVLDKETNKYVVQFVTPTGQPIPMASTPATAVGAPTVITGGQKLTAAESKAAATGRTLADQTGVAPVSAATTVTSATPSNGTTTDTTGKRKAYVDAQLVTQKLEDTPANRKKLREEFNATQLAGKTAISDTAWEATFKEKFPSKAWLLTEIDRTKYPQLFSVIQNAVTTKMYDSTTGQALFAEQLQGTDFYKQISTSGKVQQIKKLVGNLGFDTTDFVQFVNTAINYGWTDDKLKQETYKNAFDTDPNTGKYLNPNAVARVRASAEYVSTQNIAKQYFNMGPSESDILKVLTGEQTSADYEMQQREFAKTKESYKHLAPLLDLGMTLTGIADSYRKTASDLLEVNPNSIDMSTANYEQALTYNDNGKMRLMTNGEWEKLLRTDPRYKWEYTNNAKSEARSLSSNIAQALGKVI